MITGSMNGNVTQLTNVRNTISVAATEEAMAMVIAVVCIITHSHVLSMYVLYTHVKRDHRHHQ